MFLRRNFQLLPLLFTLFLLALSLFLAHLLHLVLIRGERLVLDRLIIIKTTTARAAPIQLRILPDVVVAKLADLITTGARLEVFVGNIHFLDT